MSVLQPSPTLDARYFDGCSSRAREVRIHVADGRLWVRAADDSGFELRLAADALTVDEPLGAVRRIGLPQGAHLEVRGGAELEAVLAALGWRESMLSRSQRSSSRALMALFALLVMAVAAYLWGVPGLASVLAPRLPQALVAELDRNALQSLQRSRMLRPSYVVESRRQRLQQGLASLDLPTPVTLHFQRMPGIGANAFALPGGSVVLGDELVALAPDDAHVLAVLAHEAGHVHHRHGLRMLIQGSLTAVAMGVWLGDFSGLAASVSTLALNNRYSRTFENEADAFAVAALQRAGQDPATLARMLEVLEASHRRRQSADEAEAEGDTGAADDWLSTHPATAERAARIRALAAAGAQPLPPR